MKKKSYCVIAGILLFLYPIKAFCQDSIPEPVIIQQTVYVVEEKNHNFYLFIGPSFSRNRDSYHVCPLNDCEAYFQNVMKATKNLGNNSYSAGLAFSPGKFYSELNLSYTRYRDRFNYTDPSGISFKSINHYDYLDIGMLMGYRINKWWSKVSFQKRSWRKRTSYIILGGIVFNKTISVNGQTLSKKYGGKVIPITEQLQFYGYNYQFEIGGRIMYRLKSNFYLMTGPFYSYDLRSIIKTSEIYIRQRNIIGVNFYLMYNL